MMFVSQCNPKHSHNPSWAPIHLNWSRSPFLSSIEGQNEQKQIKNNKQKDWDHNVICHMSQMCDRWHLLQKAMVLGGFLDGQTASLWGPLSDFSGSMPSIPPYQASVGVLERSKMLPSALEVALTSPTPDTTSHMYSMLNCRRCLGSGVVSSLFTANYQKVLPREKCCTVSILGV